MKTILNNATAWGVEADKINANFTDILTANEMSLAGIQLNYFIKQDGSLSPAINWTVRKILGVKAGDTIQVKSTLTSTGSTNIKIAYAFYSSDIVSIDSFISGASAIGGTVSTFESVVIPTGTKMACVTVDVNNICNVYKLTGYNTSKTVVLVGDSLTALGSGYSNYFISGRANIIPVGKGGETTLHNLGRLGAIPFIINSEFTIPADTTPVSISLSSSWNNTPSIPLTDVGMNDCYVRGIKGTITIVAGVSCTFTRLVSGSAVDVKIGEMLIPYSAINYNNQSIILWMGQNGGWTNADDLVAQFEAVARWSTNGKYLFITSHINTSDEIETKMLKKFGKNYFNMRQWSVNYGLEESGIAPVQADVDAIALGNCPPSLLSDGTHFITAAKQAQASIINRISDTIGVI
jgi:hypothetical protein